MVAGCTCSAMRGLLTYLRVIDSTEARRWLLARKVDDREQYVAERIAPARRSQSMIWSHVAPSTDELCSVSHPVRHERLPGQGNLSCNRGRVLVAPAGSERVHIEACSKDNPTGSCLTSHFSQRPCRGGHRESAASLPAPMPHHRRCRPSSVACGGDAACDITAARATSVCRFNRGKSGPVADESGLDSGSPSRPR